MRRALFALGCRLGVAGRRQREENVARIVMLHGTSREAAGGLERNLLYLRRHFDIVPLATIANGIAAGGRALRGQVALTFDDGLRNNVEVAYPILRRLGICATFFVCPELIDEGRWLWNQEARQRLRRLLPAQVAALAAGFGCAAAVEPVIAWMKLQPLDIRRPAEDEIRKETPGFQPSAKERHAYDLAGWSALRALDPGVVTIGSHTLTHPILPGLTPAEAHTEIAGSRRQLEYRLQRRVEQFAYPNGGFDSAILKLVRKHYTAAVSVEPDYVGRDADPHLLPRINMQRNPLRLALAMHVRRG